MTTGMPSWAIFWTIPLPMLPAPMTPILLIWDIMPPSGNRYRILDAG